MSKQSLLLVDGDQRSQRVLEVQLRKAGFTVTVASTAADALEKISLAVPDLIISETVLDGMDGFALCQAIKESPAWAQIPFVFLTNDADLEFKVKGLRLGVDDYLTKPIYIKEVITRLQILLQKRERTRIEVGGRDARTRFEGELTEFAVVDLVQTIEIGRKSGVIQFTGPQGRQAAVYFRDGHVVDAEAGPLQAEEAVYRLLTWNEGHFEVVFRTVRRRDAIAVSTQALLMEGMRRLDEWTRLLEQLPPLHQRYEVDALELAERLGEIPDEQNALLRLLDGRRTLEEVIDGSTAGVLETVQAISRLYFEGLLTESGREEAEREHSGLHKRLAEWAVPSTIFDETPADPADVPVPSALLESGPPQLITGAPTGPITAPRTLPTSDALTALATMTATGRAPTTRAANGTPPMEVRGGEATPKPRSNKRTLPPPLPPAAAPGKARTPALGTPALDALLAATPAATPATTPAATPAATPSTISQASRAAIDGPDPGNVPLPVQADAALAAPPTRPLRNSDLFPTASRTSPNAYPRAESGEPIAEEAVEAVTSIDSAASNAVPVAALAGAASSGVASSFRPSGLRLIDEAVAAAQAIAPELFAAEPAAEMPAQAEAPPPPPPRTRAPSQAPPIPSRTQAPIRKGPTKPPPPPREQRTMDAVELDADGIVRPVRSEASQLRMIASLGAQSAEASGELRLPTSDESRTTARQMVTIQPRRTTREQPAITAAAAEPTNPPTATAHEPVRARTSSVRPLPPQPAARDRSRVTSVPPPASGTARTRNSWRNLTLAVLAIAGITAAWVVSRDANRKQRRGTGSAAVTPGSGTGSGAIATPGSGTGSGAPIKVTAIEAGTGTGAGTGAAAGTGNDIMRPVGSGSGSSSGSGSGSGSGVELPAPVGSNGSATQAGTGSASSPSGAAAKAIDEEARTLRTAAQRALDENELDQALNLAKQSLALRRSARTYLIQADAQRRGGDSAAALRSIEAAVAMAPSLASAWRLKGKILWGNREYPAARQAYERSLQLDPNSAESDRVRTLITSQP